MEIAVLELGRRLLWFGFSFSLFIFISLGLKICLRYCGVTVGCPCTHPILKCTDTKIEGQTCTQNLYLLAALFAALNSEEKGEWRVPLILATEVVREIDYSSPGSAVFQSLFGADTDQNNGLGRKWFVGDKSRKKPRPRPRHVSTSAAEALAAQGKNRRKGKH